MKWFKKKEKQERQNKPKKDIELMDVALTIFMITAGVGLLVLCVASSYAIIKGTNSNTVISQDQVHQMQQTCLTNQQTCLTNQRTCLLNGQIR